MPLRRFLAPLILMMAVLPVEGRAAPAAADTVRNLLEVQDQAETRAPNDSLRLLAAVVTEHKESGRAVAENARLSRDVLEALRGLKGEGLKLQTEQYRIQPRYDHKARPPRIAGYRVHNTVSATLEGMETARLAEAASQLADAAVQAGANNIQGVSFYVRDREAHEQSALREATRKAMARARVLAEAAGVRLKRIAYLDADAPASPGVNRVRGAAMAERGAPPPFETGESVFQARVTLRYEIE